MSTFSFWFQCIKKASWSLRKPCQKADDGTRTRDLLITNEGATTCATSAYILLSINLWSLKNLSKADDGTRTRDLLITNEVRYHLCHISLFAGLYFARHALLYYFPNVLSTPFLSFFIFIKKDINLALRLYKELNCVKIHAICSCYFNSQSVFLRSLTCRK